MSNQIEIVERKEAPTELSTFIEGLPDVGLVGVIAATHLVETLGLVEVAAIESDLLPPVLVLHKGLLTNPVRVFAGKGLAVVTSEIAIPPTAVYPLVKKLADWVQKKHVGQVISVSGFPAQDRTEIETPQVFGVAIDEKTMQLLQEHKVEVMEEGFVVGIYALLLKECAKRRIPAVALLAQAFLSYPDPGAAASALLALSKILKVKFDVQPLLEKGDEIRLKARDLMKQAQGAISGMQKGTEQEIPLMYR